MPRNILIQFRNGTAAEWTAADPVLASCELGVENDTGLAKMGDGVTSWSSLGYIDNWGSGGGSGGQDGLGWTGGAYDAQTGIVTFTSDDGLGFTTGDLRGSAGSDGADGSDGQNGQDGADGLSAYQIWINEGNTGTEADFLNSLIGADGADGTNGTDGQDGANGQDGADGQGVPSGGAAGQLLSKIDNTDYNTQWVDAPSGGTTDAGKSFSAYNNSQQTSNSTSFEDTTNWTQDVLDDVFSFNASTGVLTVNHTGTVMIGYNITLEQTTGNNRAQPRARVVNVSGTAQIEGLRAEGYTRQTDAGDRQCLAASRPISVTSGASYKVQFGVNSTSYTHRIVSGGASFWAYVLS